VRLDQKDVRYADAERVFIAAYQRASELAARHPRDGDMLFERAQAEYWIGFVARQRGDFAVERAWFTHCQPCPMHRITLHDDRRLGGGERSACRVRTGSRRRFCLNWPRQWRARGAILVCDYFL
jgi:hypothetical protein